MANRRIDEGRSLSTSGRPLWMDRAESKNNSYYDDDSSSQLGDDTPGDASPAFSQLDVQSTPKKHNRRTSADLWTALRTDVTNNVSHYFTFFNFYYLTGDTVPILKIFLVDISK